MKAESTFGIRNLVHSSDNGRHIQYTNNTHTNGRFIMIYEFLRSTCVYEKRVPLRLQLE